MPGDDLSGRVQVLAGLAKIRSALDLEPAEVLALPRPRRQVPGLAVADLVSDLAALRSGR